MEIKYEFFMKIRKIHGIVFMTKLVSNCSRGVPGMSSIGPPPLPKKKERKKNIIINGKNKV